MTLSTKKYIDMDKHELMLEYNRAKSEYDEYCGMHLTLDLSRGKPNSDQLDISLPLLSEARPREKCFSINGVDCRNYGVLDGIPEMKKLFADMLGIDEKYVTVGLVSKNEKTRTLNFVLDFDAPAEKQTIVNLLEALAAIADIDASIDLSTLSGSVVATLDFSKDGRYGVIMAAAVAYARSEHRTELVEAIKVAMATDDYKALEAALNKVSVGDFIDALKALGSTEFEDMMNALGLSEVEYFASLESVYEYVLNIAGRLVSRLGISGGYSKVLGAINTKNANEARYVFDREYVNGHINIDLTMVLFNENTTFAPAESEIPEISVESESIYGFAIVERDGLKIFVLDAVCGGITVDELKAAMNVEIEVLGKNGADLVATKDIVKIVENGEEYNVAITGDTSCDGLVNADDATAWANTFVGVLEGDVVIEVAADVFFDGQSNGADLARLIQKYAQAANYGSNVQ